MERNKATSTGEVEERIVNDNDNNIIQTDLFIKSSRLILQLKKDEEDEEKHI